MARDFRTSRFRGHKGVGEDVNPSAYIVNLADCMLVLACGFLVALISFYNIDVSGVQKLEESQLQQVDPEMIPEELLAGDGGYYVEAGTVYRDPNTGILYMVEEAPLDTGRTGTSAASGSTQGTGAGAATGAGTAAGTNTGSQTGTGGKTTGQIAADRANGAD